MLAEAIASIKNQTYTPIEIVIVNDGGEPIEGIAAYNLQNSRGPAGARNEGVKRSHGEIIAYLDDDDIYYPNHIKMLVNPAKLYCS